ncbi:MAG: CAP domain-containing protein [Chloroflexi bacterium]|nr:CAP domain-containing protein [Chloroflexota bacterium]
MNILNIQRTVRALIVGFMCFNSISFAFSPLPAAAQQDEKSWLLSQINNLRAQVGVPGYALNAQLGAAAQQHSEYMATTGHISHQQSNGSRPVDRARANGYAGGWISENIYGGTLATAADAWNFWLNSPVHYAGLTNANTNEIGIGVATTERGSFYTLVFGKGSGVTAPQVDVPPEDAASPPEGNAAAAPPPTRRPPPPTRTLTPSPTIPTLTPTPSWTFTATWTATASMTSPPNTATPIILPTAAVVTNAPTVVAADAQPDNTAPAADPSEQREQRADDSKADGLKPEDLLPYFLAGQVILISIGIVSLFRRRKS